MQYEHSGSLDSGSSDSDDESSSSDSDDESGSSDSDDEGGSSDSDDEGDNESDDESDDEGENVEGGDVGMVVEEAPSRTIPEIYSENDLRLLLEHCGVIRQALAEGTEGADGVLDITIPQQSLLDGSLFRIDTETSQPDMLDAVWAELDR